MKRDLEKLSSREYDLVIVGGGIYGACAAWDAALRGLHVALVEKEDFGGGTSFNSTRIGHGGLRYLQHADFKRMRESIQERTNLLRSAPHLVGIQPYLLPTYGHGTKGREIMGLALAANDLISLDRLWVKDPSKRVPNGKIISKEEALKICPAIKREGLTGAAIWHDGFMHNTERLTFSNILSAVEAGAAAANYAEVVSFMMESNQVTGVRVRDNLTGNEYKIRGKMVLNTTGPWAIEMIKGFLPASEEANLPMTKVFTLVTRQIVKDYAAAVFSKPMYEDKDSLVKKGSQILFAIPWRGHSLLGSLHLPYDGSADDFYVTEEEIKQLLNMFNEAYTGTPITRDDVKFIYGGLLPGVEKGSATSLKHSRVIDHRKEHGVDGLVTVVSVKYTTARDVVEKVINTIMKKLGKRKIPCRTHKTPVFGGNISHFESFLRESLSAMPATLDLRTKRHLIHAYGTEFKEILNYGKENPGRLDRVSPEYTVIKAEVVHAVRREMAVKLSDVIFRRTDLGTLGDPGEEAINTCADLMGEELRWDFKDRENEICDVKEKFDKQSTYSYLGEAR